MDQVTELGYLGIGANDRDAWKHFANEIVGLETADDGERDPQPTNLNTTSRMFTAISLKPAASTSR